MIEYLVETPSPKEIKEILKMLGMTAEQLVRKKEPLYKEKYEGKKMVFGKGDNAGIQPGEILADTNNGRKSTNDEGSEN